MKKFCVSEAETSNVNAVDSDKVNDTQLFVGMLLGRDIVKFQIDCAAICNIMAINLLNPETNLDDAKTCVLVHAVY